MTHKPGYFTSEFWTNNFNCSIYLLSHSSAPQISVVSWARKTIFRFLFSCFFPPLALSLSFIDRTAKSFGHLFEALVAGNRNVGKDLCVCSVRKIVVQWRWSWYTLRQQQNYTANNSTHGRNTTIDNLKTKIKKKTNSQRFHHFHSARV